MINFSQRENTRRIIRKKLGIGIKDFVIITGGKLSEGKNTKMLVEAFMKLPDLNLKLIIFGTFSEDIRENMLSLIEGDKRIIYLGWIKGNNVYDYYHASDLGIFPGTKSALWEQVICSGIPIVCKKWEGMEYVDVGGNCRFLTEGTSDEIVREICLLKENPEILKNMRMIAETKGFEAFSYETIARQAIKTN
nr:MULTISPECIES: glycosyltransferase family 4 protein [unclassified Planococcus (in: firmicutes)]